MKRSSFFDHVTLSRERMLDRTYTRDKDGKFAHGGGVADLPRMEPPSATQAAKGTNPNSGLTTEGPTYRDAARAGRRWDPTMGPPPSGAFEENCSNCAHAFEMRMRGYDVRAAPMDLLDRYGYAAGRTQGQLDEQITSSYTLPGGKAHGRSFSSQPWKSFDEVDKEVKGWPEGGRGIVNVGKHIFSVVKKDGKAQYVEPQFDASPTRVVTGDYRRRFGGDRGKGKSAKVIRLDDLEPADGILESVVTS